MWGGMGLLAFELGYYVSDSALRRFYAGRRLIWLDFLVTMHSWKIYAILAYSRLGYCARRY